MTKPIDIDALVAKLDRLYGKSTPGEWAPDYRWPKTEADLEFVILLTRAWPAIRDELQRLQDEIDGLYEDMAGIDI